jgi:hypothetical protein
MFRSTNFRLPYERKHQFLKTGSWLAEISLYEVSNREVGLGWVLNADIWGRKRPRPVLRYFTAFAWIRLTEETRETSISIDEIQTQVRLVCMSNQAAIGTIPYMGLITVCE